MYAVNIQRKKIRSLLQEEETFKDSLINNWKDSVKATRRITYKEKIIFEDFKFGHLGISGSDYNNLSSSETDLVEYLKNKVKPIKDQIDKENKELYRLENIFRPYYKKYGKSFFHVAFKYGFTFGDNCETGGNFMHAVID